LADLDHGKHSQMDYYQTWRPIFFAWAGGEGHGAQMFNSVMRGPLKDPNLRREFSALTSQ
jgi:hypothetical protein